MALSTTTTLAEFRDSYVRDLSADQMKSIVQDAIAYGDDMDVTIAGQYLSAWLNANPEFPRDEVAAWFRFRHPSTPITADGYLASSTRGEPRGIARRDLQVGGARDKGALMDAEFWKHWTEDQARIKAKSDRHLAELNSMELYPAAGGVAFGLYGHKISVVGDEVRVDNIDPLAMMKSKEDFEFDVKNSDPGGFLRDSDEPEREDG